MPICFDRKLLFVHIPKTGGTSVIDYFGFKENTRNLWGRILNTSVEVSHLPLYAINELYDLTDYYKFCFVRNPWDRMVSEFKFGIKESPEGIKLFELTDSFETFLESIKENLPRIQNNRPSHWLTNHYQTQWSFIKSEEIKMDFIGRFENFDEDLKYLGKKFNIEKDIPFLNKTEHGDYKSYYTEKSIDLVKEIYKDDIENFHYKFD